MYTKIPLNKITQISLVQTNGRKTLSQIKAELKCQYIINGTLYDFNNFSVKCPCRINGKTVSTSKDGYWCYGWNKGSDIKMIHSKDINHFSNAFSCCTMLKDGNNTFMTYTKAQGGVRGRTAVGIDSQNNLVLFCSSDQRGAISPEKLRNYMKYDLHCRSAIMLDCGGSSQGDFNGKRITSSRKVANYICIWTAPIIDTPLNNNYCPYEEPQNLIKFRSRGNGAKWVQWHLNKTNNANLAVDGIFGSNSVRELKKFQQKNNLTVDGICGNATKVKLKQF